MGWLQGKSTRHHRLSHDIWDFPVIFPWWCYRAGDRGRSRIPRDPQRSGSGMWCRDLRDRWISASKSMANLWLIYGWWMANLWLIYGYSMDILWLIYGYSMVNKWLIYLGKFVRKRPHESTETHRWWWMDSGNHPQNYGRTIQVSEL